MTTRFSRRAMACALLSSTALAAPASAQEASVSPFPVREYVDENGVDLLTGLFTAYSPSIRIGSPEMGLSYVRQIRGHAFRDSMMGDVTISGSTYTVDIAGRSESFALLGGNLTALEENGSTLMLSNGVYTYTRSDGTSATFTDIPVDFGNANGRVLLTLTYPSGRSLSYHYVSISYNTSSGARYGRRLQSVASNAGYHMKLQYDLDTVASSSDERPWTKLKNVKGLNPSVDSCSYVAFSCSQSGRPELKIANPSANTYTYEDSQGRVTTFTTTTVNLLEEPVSAVKLPGSVTNDITISYSGSSVVNSITRFGVVTSYSYSDSNGIRTVTVTKPDSRQSTSPTRTLTFDLTKRRMTSVTDERGKKTEYQYGLENRLERIIQPEGNHTHFTYDDRGNIKEVRRVAKYLSGVPDIVTSAVYPETCSNPKICNLPISTTDARGFVTDYEWDPNHGGLISVKAPSSDGSSMRPETRLEYWRLDANGNEHVDGIVVPKKVSACQTGSAPACINTADEVKTSTVYGYGLLPSSISTGAGDNSLTATRTMTYDAVGNLETLDGPLPTNADTTRFRYNLNRELIGVIGPDPDGAGSRKHLATKRTFASTGLISKQEIGTVNGQSDTDWLAFASAQELQAVHDDFRRPIRSTLASSGTAYSVTQVSYDDRGRLLCSAQRLKYFSLPSSACTLETPASPLGDDRITKYTYDPAGNVTEVRAALGTNDEAVEAAYSYSPNGLLETVLDAENNLTRFEYDGQDRLAKTIYPSAIKSAGTVNVDDFEQLVYETTAGGTLTSMAVSSMKVRNRANPSAAPVIGFQYDNAGRVKNKDLPGVEPDVSYSYDLFGRLTNASQNGDPVSFSYDALNRKTGETGASGSATSTYDLSGRRLSILLPGPSTGPGAILVTYDRDVTGRLTAIRENGATSGAGLLATYTYDQLGRRQSLIRGNGRRTLYEYDPASRLSALVDTNFGSAADVRFEFEHNAAGQITQRSSSNNAYAWLEHATGQTVTVANGFNQITQIAGSSTNVDGRGNVTFDPSRSRKYGFTSENLLNASSNSVGGSSVSLEHDAMLRLSKVSANSTVKFGYDGLDLLVEADGSGNLLRRYVPGDGLDEPVVWYEGATTTDRRWLHADERGTVIGVSDGSGVVTINTYDEFGKPASGNSGRYQYTGQKWIGDVGLYDYKYRMYAPHLGRFMQSDPVRHASGTNHFAYTKNDPVNFTDPLGWDPLSSGNQAAANLLFGDGFDASRIDLKFNSNFTLGRAAITVGNTILIKGDSISKEVLFHELTHSWQVQTGRLTVFQQWLTQMNDFAGAKVYDYKIGPDSRFEDYNSEAQAQIIQDCLTSGNQQDPACQLVSSSAVLGGNAGDGLVATSSSLSSFEWRLFFYLFSLENKREPKPSVCVHDIDEPPPC